MLSFKDKNTDQNLGSFANHFFTSFLSLQLSQEIPGNYHA